MAPAAQGESTSSKGRPVVLLTGYGLFRNYSNNSSQEVVEQIEASGIEGIELHTEIFPVEYAYVKKRTEELFEKVKPLVTIHCGMHSEAKAIIMEQIARNMGYDVADVQGDIPCNKCCVESSSCDFLKTGLDLEKIVLNCKTPLPVYISRDAGLYLCEYVYYCALAKSEKSLFIHIPAVSAEYPLDKLVKTVKQIVLLAVQQCQQQCNDTS